MRLRIAVITGLVLLAVLAYTIRSNREPDGTAPAAPSHSDPAKEVASNPHSAPSSDESEADATAPDSLPAPVDLDAADRELDLCGRVVDAEGAAVAGARIEALIPVGRQLGGSDPWTPLERLLDRETRSASDGSFLFRLAERELRILRVAHAGFAETELPSCAAGQRVEIVLHPGARVVLTASDSEGEPVAEVRIRLTSRARGGVIADRRGETDASGVAEFVDLPPGTYSIRLAHDRLECRDPGVFALPSGETIELPVTLREGRTVSGTVRDRATGLPIAGALVIDGQMFLSGRSVTTDALGRYTLSGLEFLELRAEADGYGQARVELSGEETAPIDIDLPRADAAVGALVDEAGRPLVGIAATAVIPGTQSKFRETRRATTAEDGSFRIESLHPDGPHTLVVIEPGFARLHLDFDQRLRRPDGVIDLGTILLRRGRSIEGELVGADGSPVPWKGVSLWGHGDERNRLLPGSGSLAMGDDGSSHSRKTDIFGRFRFSDLAVGEYRVTAAIEGWAAVRETVRIEEGGPEPEFVRLALAAGEEHVFRLVTPEDDPVPGVRLTARGKEGGVASGTSDESGIVRIGGIPAPFLVSLGVPPGFLDRLPFEVDPRGGTEAIVIERESIVSGIVLAPDGAPLPFVYLDVIERVPTRGHEAGRIAQTQLDGTFRIPVAPGAELDLVCNGVFEEGPLRGPSKQVWTGFQGKLTGLVAPAEGVRFRLERVATDRNLIVRVVDSGGSPVAGARIVPTIDGSRMEVAPAETDAEGIAMLAGLPAMPLFIRCVPPEPPPGSLWRWLPPGPERLTPAGQEWRVALQRGASLTGIVVDEAGAPVKDAIVRATTSAQRRMALHSPRGEFEFILLDGETVDLEAEVRRAGGGKGPRGELRGAVAGPEPVRIVVRME